jgi:hypothetical protein
MFGNYIFIVFVYSITLFISISVQAEEKVNIQNCYGRSVGGLYDGSRKFCQIVEVNRPSGFEEIKNNFISLEDKYGNHLNASFSVYDSLKDGKATRNELYQLADTLGTIYGIGPVASSLGLGPKKGPSVQDVLRKVLMKLTQEIKQAKTEIINTILTAITETEVEADKARLQSLYEEVLHWGLLDNAYEKFGVVSSLSDMKAEASLLSSRKINSFNSNQHIMELHSFLHLTSTYMHLISEFFTISKLSANQEYLMSFSDLSSTFKESNSIFNELDFENWKKNIDKEILSDLKVAWADVALDFRKYLIHIDSNLNEWRTYVDSQFSEVDFNNEVREQHPAVFTPQEIVSITELIGYPNYKYRSVCTSGKAYELSNKSENDGHGNDTRAVDPYRYRFKYAVSGVDHYIYRVKAACWYRSTRHTFDTIYSDEYGNASLDWEKLIGLHKQLEYERILQRIYKPVYDVVKGWWLTSDLESKGYSWDDTEADRYLKNPVSTPFNSRVITAISEAKKGNNTIESTVLTGNIHAFYLDLEPVDSFVYENLTLKVTSSGEAHQLVKLDCSSLNGQGINYYGDGGPLVNLNIPNDEDLDLLDQYLSAKPKSNLCFGVLAKAGITSVNFGVSVDYQLVSELVARDNYSYRSNSDSCDDKTTHVIYPLENDSGEGMVISDVWVDYVEDNIRSLEYDTKTVTLKSESCYTRLGYKVTNSAGHTDTAYIDAYVRGE